MRLRVCVCVNMCVRERETETDTENYGEHIVTELESQQNRKIRRHERKREMDALESSQHVMKKKYILEYFPSVVLTDGHSASCHFS